MDTSSAQLDGPFSAAGNYDQYNFAESTVRQADKDPAFDSAGGYATPNQSVIMFPTPLTDAPSLNKPKASEDGGTRRAIQTALIIAAVALAAVLVVGLLVYFGNGASASVLSDKQSKSTIDWNADNDGGAPQQTNSFYNEQSGASPSAWLDQPRASPSAWLDQPPQQPVQWYSGGSSVDYDGAMANAAYLDGEPSPLTSGVPIDAPLGDDAPQTTYYVPSPMPTPPARSSSSTFDAPTRGAAAAELDADAALRTDAAVAQIYGGKANSVLGGEHRPPYGVVHDDAARHMGWSAIPEEAAPQSERVPPSADAKAKRSMHELYQQRLPSTPLRDGSSASTMTTPEQAADRGNIGHNPDLANQFAQGRAKSKQVAAEAAAAINGIYDRKHKQAAGLSAAAAQRDREQNDANFDYFNVQTQQPFGDDV